MQALQLNAEWAPKPEYKMTQREQETRKIKNGFMVWKNPSIELGTHPDPTPARDEVVLEIGAVGICGSDMHMYERGADGYMIYPGYVTAPNILGHEFAGRVVAVGSDVTDLKEGDLVAVEEIQWCGECVACRRGYVNHCENMEELGFTTPGAMAQYTPVRAKYCWKLDELADRLGDETEALVLGAMVEPTGVAYQGMFNRLQTWQPGANAVIFGAGPIGLAAEALAIAAGAAQVIMIDPSASRREIAKNMGATHVLDSAEVHDLNEALLELTYGRGVDFVVECAGVPDKTIQNLTYSLAVHATISHIGMGGTPPSLQLVHYQQRGVQLAGSLGHSGHGTFQNIIRLMAAGRIDMRKMVSARMALSEAEAAFKRLESREDAKIILMPNS